MTGEASGLRSLKGESSLDKFDQVLIRVIGNDHPETLEKAIELARLKLADCDESVADHVLRLEGQGRILFEKPLAPIPSSLVGFFLSSWALWFWAVFASALATTVMVFVVPENAFPLVYARYVFGGVFVLFLPGFSLIKALFGSKELDSIERLALSIGLSLALVPLAGLLLNYSPWGIRTTPVTLSLLALTLVFASAAVVRDYGVRVK
jgi:hypothetical protein